MRRILLITGWGLGVRPLVNLHQALEHQGFDVQLIDMFNIFDAKVLEQQLQHAQTFDVIMGWSLGGQLAAELCQKLYERTKQTKILITLASNPKFVASESWDVGMDRSTFISFKDSFKKDPSTTLKRFCYLVTQGHPQAKQNWLKLQDFIQQDNYELNKQGLELLESLNCVDILKNYQSNQFHLFAKGDGLVHHKVQDYFKKMPAKFLSLDMVEGSHGFPVFQSDLISGKISQYLKSI